MHYFVDGGATSRLSKDYLSCRQPSDNHVAQNKSHKNTTLLIHRIYFPGNMSLLLEFPAKILKVQLKTLNHFDSVKQHFGQSLNR